MAILNVQQILDRTPETPEEEVFLVALGGSIRIRGMRTTTEFGKAQLETTKAMAARDRGFNYKGIADAELSAAASLMICYLPQEGEEPLDYGTALQLVGKIGAQAILISNKIAELSGLTAASLKEKEDALAANGFPAGDRADQFGVSPSAPE